MAWTIEATRLTIDSLTMLMIVTSLLIVDSRWNSIFMFSRLWSNIDKVLLRKERYCRSSWETSLFPLCIMSVTATEWHDVVRQDGYYPAVAARS
jgi:hypothetical protein